MFEPAIPLSCTELSEQSAARYRVRVVHPQISLLSCSFPFSDLFAPQEPVSVAARLVQHGEPDDAALREPVPPAADAQTAPPSHQEPGNHRRRRQRCVVCRLTTGTGDVVTEADGKTRALNWCGMDRRTTS